MGLKNTWNRTGGKLFKLFNSLDIGSERGAGNQAYQLGTQQESFIAAEGATMSQYRFIAASGTLTGGTVYPNVTIGSDQFNIHRWGPNPTYPWTGTLVVSNIVGAPGTVDNVDILVVSGGGGGSGYGPPAHGGGGGGGGGVRWIPNIKLSAGTFPVIVGDGGSGSATQANAGEDSKFNAPGGNGLPAIVTDGGGYGGYGGNIGGPGGNGGGKSYPGDQWGEGNASGDDPRASPASEGFPSGGSPTSTRSDSGSQYRCGGGGGASGTGSGVPYQNGIAGLQIPGIGPAPSPWLPPSGNTFSGGGGGSSYKETHGNGEGGAGGGGDAPGNPGINFSGGGAGGKGTPSGNGGTGGKGVVFVKVPAANTSNPG